MADNIFGKDKNGDDFPDNIVRLVWNKAGTTMLEPRKTIDACGSEIRWEDYGNTNSSYGWEIDHIVPLNVKRDDGLDNLQPLQWENNRKKGDKDWEEWKGDLAV